MALALSPDNARALYYMALVERRAGNPELEEADLRKVVQQYPLSRDARRELGKSFYRQGKEHEAMEQFEALQAIDPDDVAAHYNLAILYGRMGIEDKATAQAAFFANKKADPGAPTLSLDFLLKHPEIQTESVPWHVHVDLEQEAGVERPRVPKAGGNGDGGSPRE